MKKQTFAMVAVGVLLIATVGVVYKMKNSAVPKSSLETKGLATDATKDDAYAEALTFDNKAWKHDATNDVYYQTGVKYASKPETTDYETLGIYVPSAYMTATDNGDGTYTAKANPQGSINGLTTKTAPMVFPVDTPGYMAQKAPTTYNYNQISSYLKAGFIYVFPGMRGRANGYDANKTLAFSGGAPWGVTDLKAAVRYVRYNKNVLPGNTDSTFVFGMSGGGAQTAVMGASGDSKLYTPYLKSIGAAMYYADGSPISDTVSGAMAWCPVTSLDQADEAYEWNLGQYVSTNTRANTTWTSALSKDLAAEYADYISKLGIKDKNGNVLTLEKSDNSIYTQGSYYDYLKSVIEESLNNFLADTKFPYTKTAGGMMGSPGDGGPAGGFPAGGPDGDGGPDGAMPKDGILREGGANNTAAATSTTYQTVQDYIAALNKDVKWVTYDAATNKATISSIAAFVNSQKNPSKSVGAFDGLNRAQGENDVFGNDTNDSLHFDSVLADLLAKNQTKYAAFSDWKASYVDDYALDLKAVDKLNNGMEYRMNMYNPMYYLTSYYAGYQTATPAKYWRIRTGIEQGDTALTTETNLALALQNYKGVQNVDFATVWGMAHVKAERTGDSTANFITWVTETVKK